MSGGLPPAAWALIWSEKSRAPVYWMSMPVASAKTSRASCMAPASSSDDSGPKTVTVVPERSSPAATVVAASPPPASSSSSPHAATTMANTASSTIHFVRFIRLIPPE